MALEKETTKALRGKGQNQLQLGRGGSFGRLVLCFPRCANYSLRYINCNLTRLLISAILYPQTSHFIR